MSSAGKLFYILFEEIMLIINIDQADLHYRWSAKVFLFSDGGKTALKNHARLNYFYFDYTVIKNTWLVRGKKHKEIADGRTGRNGQKMVCRSTADQENNKD